MALPDLSFLTTRQIPRTWVILGIVVLAVPFALFLASMKGCACASIANDRALAERTGPDSIRIVLHPDPSVHFGRLPVLSVFANEQEVSNLSAALHAGLPLTVSPPDGLAYADGAALTLQGNWVAGSATAPVHVVTVASYENGEMTVIQEQYV